ncbi:MAG: hypothetical protein RI580_17885, partial [Halothece sp. Uz-M2-17]|nr:hypothetical protein [Halothece sp. Uz-M2-17]
MTLGLTWVGQLTCSVVGIAYILSGFPLLAHANENQVNLRERVAEETGIDVGVDLQNELTDIIAAEALDNMQQLLEALSGIDSDLQQQIIEEVEEAGDVETFLEAIEAGNLEDQLIQVVAIARQGDRLEAIAGQVVLNSPQELLNQVDITFAGREAFDAVDVNDLNEDETVNGNELKIDFETIAGDDPNFNIGNNPSESEIISLVRAFTNGIGQQERDRATVTAFRKDNNIRSAMVAEVELAPGQSFVNNLENQQASLIMTTDTETFNGDEVLSELSIARSDGADLLADNNNLEVELAEAVKNANFNSASSVISLVRAFGEGVEQEQARLSGASLVEDQRDSDNEMLSVVAGEVELAPGQLLTQDNNNGVTTLVTVASDLAENNGTVRTEGLNIKYFIDETSINLEAAIAEQVQGNDFSR